MSNNASVDGSTIELIVRNKEIHMIQKDLLTSSQQKNKVKFNFVGGPPWENLQKTIIFRVEKELYNIALGADGVVNIPWEVCQDQYLGKIIYVGVRGVDNGGTLIYPTPFFRLGVLENGAGMIGTQEPSDPTMPPYDEAVRLSKLWAIGPNNTTETPSATNNSKYWSDEAKILAKTAQDAVTQAQSARDQYPKIGSNGHWEYYIPEQGRYVDSGMPAQFTIRKVYETVEAMMADYNGNDTTVGDFVMISGDMEAPDTGKLYVKVADNNVKFSFIADLSGAQGIQGPQGPAGPAGADGKDGAGMDITGATVDQIAKITAVDDTGKPTAWEAVDMPSGGGSAVELDTTLTQSGKAADAKAVGDALAEKEAAYQPDLPEGYIYVQEIPENADTSKIYVLPDGYAYKYSERTVVEKHNANTGLVNIKPDTNANYQSLSAQSGVLTSDLIPFSADWVPTTADRANSTIKVSGIAKLVPAYYNSSVIVYLYYADGSWMGTARTSQIDSLGNPALGSEVSVPVEWYLKDTNSAGVVGGWSNVGYVRVLLGISTSGDITSEDVAGVVINVPFYDTEQVVTGWARNGEKFAISFSDAVKQNTLDIEGLDVRVSALEASGGGGSGGGEETTVQTNQILYAVGDSITYGYGVGGNSGSWVRHVIDRNGYDATNSHNLGESGLGFCTASTSNHTVQDIVGSTDFSGADIVTVALGINDWKNYNALLTDVWSGMEYVFGKIRGDNPYCKIYFIVPFNVSIATSAYATFYGLGYAGDNNPLRPYAHTLLEFIGMLKERFALSPLNAYNVQIIDLTEGVAINRQNITTALIDNLHPTAETHIELGKEIAPILRFNNHHGQTAAQVQSAIGAIQAWQGGSY